MTDFLDNSSDETATEPESGQELQPQAPRPWPPIPMVLATLFGGLPAGGLLLGLNWARLGESARGRRDLILFALLTIGTFVLGSLWAGAGDATETHQAKVRWAMQSIHVVTALFVAIQQRTRFEGFLANGGRPGNLLLALPLAVAFGIFVQLALARLIGRLVLGG